MSDTVLMTAIMTGLSTMTQREGAVLNAVGGVLKKMPFHILQEYACQSRTGDKAINLDTDKVCGIFSLASCSGTKPTTYGIALVFGGGSDWYQLVLGSNRRVYYRANTNNNVYPWVRLSNDADYVAPSSGGGGGKQLLFNYLRNLAERRVA